MLGFEVEKRFYIEAARSHTAIVREGFGEDCFIRCCAGNLIDFVEVAHDCRPPLPHRVHGG